MWEMTPVLGILLAFLFIFLNAFFVLAEFAIVKVRKSRVQELLNKGNPFAPLLAQRILPRLDPYLSAIQIGITISSLALGWIGEPAVGRLMDGLLRFLDPQMAEIPYGVSFGIAFFLVTAGHVILGELIPKSIAIQKADVMALWCARPLQFFYILFYPILFLFNSVANGLLALIGMRPKDAVEIAHSAQELRILLASSRDRGMLDPQVHAIIDNAFRFRAQKVGDVMVPRERVAVLFLGHSWEENFEVIRRHRHTRYPVCEADIDHPMGLIHIKDIMLRAKQQRKIDLTRLARDVVEVAPEMSLERALPFLRARSAHLAMVRSSEGQIEGIVCLEDIVEQIVGTLEDEFDREEKLSLMDLLKPELINTKFEAADKKQLLEKGVALLCAHNSDLNYAATLKAVEEREDLFSTGIGGGVAIPHAVLEELDQPMVAVLRLRKPVRYGSIDLLPVKLVFFFILPATNPTLRIRFFSEIARILQLPNAYYQLTSVSSADKFIALIQKFLKSGVTV